MKQILFALIVLGFLAPSVAFAHGGMMGVGSIDDGFEMMRYVEDQALGDELHEEMESLMAKMMSGSLTQEEQQRMVELMDENPGIGGMMSARMMGMVAASPAAGYGYMHGNGDFFGAVFYWFLMSIWFLVGVLLVVWLIKNITGK